MLNTLRTIVQAVSVASDLDEAAAIAVRRVREAMAVDACSIYLIDELTGEYVLTAGEGLAPRYVGQVRVGHGDGLVGFVGERQESVNLSECSTHPRYRCFPETADEGFAAFLGVPLIHQARLMGVLVVQRRRAGSFAEDETAFLVTIAAQLSGVINHAVMDGSVRGLLGERDRRTQFLQGIQGASGVAIGKMAVVFPLARLESVPNREVNDVRREEDAFRTAVTRVQEELRAGGTRLSTLLPAEERALFDLYEMLAGSDSLISDTVRGIQAGNWAPGALRETIAKHAAVFEEMEDPYLRARSEDIRAVGRHILVRLQSERETAKTYPERCILVGDELSVAQIAEVPVGTLIGIICMGGSGLSHTAILARALGIPAVMGLGDLSLGALDGREVIVDGYQGRVYIQPSGRVRAEYERLLAEEAAMAKGLKGLQDLPAETPDGVKVSLNVNTGLLADFPGALDTGAEGVGLYRTEFAFLIRSSFPGEEEQYRVYRKALMLFAPKPVTMRTLDVGGDKPLPYFFVEEDNPFLGWRGIRVTLDHPEIFLTQLRAMLRANVGLNNLRILLPMISQVGEVDATIRLLDRAHQELVEEGQQSARPPLGVMVETPSAIHQIPALMRRVDFISIGTNDLTQYLLAVDRNNARVASLYDNLHPAVIHAVRQVTEETLQWGKPVSVCGEMAGDPAAAILLLGMGVENFSMAGPELPRIKQVIRTFSRARALQLLEEALRMDAAVEVRALLSDALDQAGLGGFIRAGR